MKKIILKFAIAFIFLFFTSSFVGAAEIKTSVEVVNRSSPDVPSTPLDKNLALDEVAGAFAEKDLEYNISNRTKNSDYYKLNEQQLVSYLSDKNIKMDSATPQVLGTSTAVFSYSAKPAIILIVVFASLLTLLIAKRKFFIRKNIFSLSVFDLLALMICFEAFGLGLYGGYYITSQLLG